MSTETYYNVSGGFGAIAAAFVLESLERILVWLMVMTAVIICDLISGMSKSYRTKVKIRFSKACRDSMAKFATYFSCVVCACMIQVAAQTEWSIEKWVCGFVIFVELTSIAGNILKYHGYNLNLEKLVGVVLKKTSDIDMEDSQGIITKEQKSHENKSRNERVDCPI